MVFFRKGHFFELFDIDADLASRELGLKVTMRGRTRLAGVPTSRLDEWAAVLLNKGHRVVVVDEVETQRQQQQGGHSKGPLERRLTAVWTPGTRVDDHLLTGATTSASLLVLVEAPLPPGGRGPSLHRAARYWLCLCDASTGSLRTAELEDDEVRSQLQGVLVKERPQELLLSTAHVSARTRTVLANELPLATITYRALDRNLAAAHRSLQEIVARLPKGSLREAVERQQMSPGGLGGETQVLALLLAYLDELLLLEPLAAIATLHRGLSADARGHGSVLDIDGVSLTELGITSPSPSQECLLSMLLAKTCTPFGARLLRRWVLYPSCSPVEITSRADSCHRIRNHWAPDLVRKISSDLAKLPDLPRKITRLGFGPSVNELVAVLRSLSLALEIVLRLQQQQQHHQPWKFDAEALVQHLDTLRFDQPKAISSGQIVPPVGFFPEFDRAVTLVEESQALLAGILEEEKGRLGRSLVYTHQNSARYQLEVPVATKVPSRYLVVSKTKAVARYHTKEIRQAVEPLEAHEEELLLISKVVRMVLLFFSRSWKPKLTSSFFLLFFFIFFFSFSSFLSSFPSSQFANMPLGC